VMVVDETWRIDNPSITVTSRVPWIGQVLGQNQIHASVTNSKRKMLEYINRTWKGEFKRRQKAAGK
jgi:hypothetical protein